MPFASREKALAYLRNYNLKRRDHQNENLKIYRQNNKEALKMKRVEYVKHHFRIFTPSDRSTITKTENESWSAIAHE